MPLGKATKMTSTNRIDQKEKGYRVEEAGALETLHDPSDLHLVWNPKTSLSCGVEETKTLQTLHDPSDLHLVWNPNTSVICGVEQTKTLKTLHDPSDLHPV